LQERLAEGVVLGDGGYLMGLRLRGFVEAGSMTPEVVVHHPEEVRKITWEFKEAGAEILQTLTDGGSGLVKTMSAKGNDLFSIIFSVFYMRLDTK